MTIEDMLRETVAPRSAADPALEERVRRDAMAALAGMRRRHRVRRVVSVGAAAAGIAAIAGLFLFAMPRGNGTTEATPGEPAPVAPAPVALLNGPARPEDHLGADAVPGDIPGTMRAMRFAGAGERLRFYAAATSGPERICIIATARSGGVSRGSACNEPSVLTRVGVLTFERGRARPGPGGRAIADQAFLVPDGITEVIAGGRRLTVRDNLATATGLLGSGRTVILVGPAAATVHPDGGPDWPRGSRSGQPTVEVPLSGGSALSSRPTAIGDIRLIVPRTAAAGSVIDMRLAGPDGLLGENVVFGIDAWFEVGYPAGWRRQWQLLFALPDNPSVPDPQPVGPDANATLDIGFAGSAPRRVRLPVVEPGTYRITKSVIAMGTDGVNDDATLSAEIEITAAP